MRIHQLKTRLQIPKHFLFRQFIVFISFLTISLQTQAQFTNKILETNFSNLPTVTSSSSTLTTGTGTALGYSWIRTTINNTITTWPYVGTSTATSIPNVVIGTSTSPCYIDLPALTFVNGGKVYIDYGSGSNREFELQDVTSGTAVTTGISGGNGSTASKFKVDNTVTYPRNTILNNTLILDANLFNGVKKLRVSLTGGSDSRIFKIIVYTAIDSPPITQTANITFSNVLFNAMTINWTNGNGGYRAVFAKQTAGAIQNPVDGTVYAASTDWVSKGTQLGTSGYYCIYNGDGNTVTLTGLNPATNYIFQSFEYNGLDALSKFLTTTATGNPATQQTKPLMAPSLTASVNPATVFSTKATANANITDAGSYPVTENGFVWSTNTGATTTTNAGKLVVNATTNTFNDLVKGLTPSTVYYLRAYAINSIGTAYSNEIVFTTAVPAPVLTSSVTTIDFSSQFYNAFPAVLTYNLVNNGANFSTTTGNITITAPAGFQVSSNASTGFASSITVPYLNSKLASTPIYVKLPTNLYGNFTGEITHSGANVLASDADKVILKGSIVQEELSNKGTDFWLGFGYEESMNRKRSDSNIPKMSIYVASGDQEATVTVDLPGINAGSFGFPKTAIIPPNSVQEFTGFPAGADITPNLNVSNEPDSRLFQTGISNKGVHVTSNGVPVSVWMHTYVRNNSAAGSMIFPTNTWNSSYTVLSSGGKVNNGYYGNSFFFVVASEDNTTFQFTPSNPIINAASSFSDSHSSSNYIYEKGQTYSITLNKGQVFNAMGAIDGSTDVSKSGLGALDLTGTKIKSTCDKKIAVFGGNGRLGMSLPDCNTTSGISSDHLIQQMLPNVAWGTKYLTVPTKTMETNKFRIVVEDPTTKVWVNQPNHTNAPLSNIINNLYYEIGNNIPNLIESDKPISVTQFIIDGACATNENFSGGKSDPEMIILSPVQQAINKVTVYSAPIKSSDANQNSLASYINVLMRKEGVASFKIDNIAGSSLVDVGAASNLSPPEVYGSVMIPLNTAFKEHLQDKNYVYAQFKVETGVSHTITSEYPFNAIAYGMSNPGGESYGYNAGTNIQNLSSIKLAVNTSATDTSRTNVKAAKGIPVRLKIALPYPPATVANLLWAVPSTDATISPAGSANGAVSGGVATFESTIIVDGRTFYVYSSPVQYTFSESGSHPITVIASGSFAGDCAGSDTQKVPVIVGLDDVNINYTTNCGNPTISFTNTTTPMAETTITKWLWDFGDGNTSNLQNPPAHVYNKSVGSVYTVKLTTTNSAGIVSSKNLNVDFSGSVKANFTNNAIANAICLGNEVRFDPASSAITSAVSGTAVKWTWNFGDGSPEVIVNNATKPVQPHTYAANGSYTVSLALLTSTGCTDTLKQTVNVFQLVPAVVTSTSTINSIEFKWDAVADAVAYQVSIDGGAFISPSSGAIGLTHEVTGLQPDQTVKIIVLAKGIGACEAASPEAEAKSLLPDLEVFVPNTFTPNNDGKNDVLKIYSNYIQSVNMKVFNQWGQQIFFGTDVNNGWDGTYKGEAQPVGVYIYIVSVTMQDGRVINKKGTVNLIR